MPTNFFSRLIFNKGWLSTDLDVFICFQPAFFEPKSNFLKNEGIENLGMSTISLSVQGDTMDQEQIEKKL